MKADCDGNCTNCNETELPNIKDKDCQSIGYSYAYKTDCAGDRYIKAEEVKYLLKCERNKAIDDFAILMKETLNHDWATTKISEQIIYNRLFDKCNEIAEQLKEVGENE